MPELRINMVSREWVLVICERAKKPEEFRRRGEELRYIPEHLDSCPFCQGNESKTPHEIVRIPSDGQWQVRVTPNKFPVLLEQGERLRINEGLKHLVTGVGRHEVIIESPRHDMTLAIQPEEEVLTILQVYRQRFIETFDDKRVQHVIIFKNHGLSSGTSIEHPHSQRSGGPVMPFQIRNRVEEAMRFFDNTGDCLQCSILADELTDKKRVIIESEHFVSFIPYAALSPFHTWIFPRRHLPSFGNITDQELSDLAHVLRTTLEKFYIGLDDPDYNMVIRSLSPYRSRSEYIHWYISIMPKVSSISGFELGTGMYVNQSIPEEVAEFLRSVKES